MMELPNRNEAQFLSRQREQLKSDVQDPFAFFVNKREEVDRIIDAIIDLAVEEAVVLLREAPPE